MVDAEVLARKTQAALHHIARLRRRAPLSAVALRADEDLWNIVLMDLLQAIQPCIDLATHAVVDEALGVPDGPASAFAMLAEAGRIPQALAVRMAGAAGLRNLIAHRYGELRPEVVARVVDRDLVELERLLAALAADP